MQKEQGVLAHSGEGRLRLLRTGFEEPHSSFAPSPSGEGASWSPLH